jgi:hypothetical protein
MGEWRYSSTILDLGTTWRVSFTPRSLYLRGNRPRYPLDRRLGGPQSRYGRCGEEKNLAPAGNRNPAVQPVARLYTDWAFVDVDGKKILKCTLNKLHMRGWTGLIWFRMGISGRLLWTWIWILEFYKARGVSWTAERLLAYKEDLCSVQFLI